MAESGASLDTKDVGNQRRLDTECHYFLISS